MKSSETRFSFSVRLFSCVQTRAPLVTTLLRMSTTGNGEIFIFWWRLTGAQVILPFLWQFQAHCYHFSIQDPDKAGEVFELALMDPLKFYKLWKRLRRESPNAKRKKWTILHCSLPDLFSRSCWSDMGCVRVVLLCNPVTCIRIFSQWTLVDGRDQDSSGYKGKYFLVLKFRHRRLAQVCHQPLLGCCWGCLMKGFAVLYKPCRIGATICKTMGH